MDLEHTNMLAVSISVNVENSHAITTHHTNTSKLYVSCEIGVSLSAGPLCLQGNQQLHPA